MRVLLTGASGFIGAHVLKAILRRTDWDVVAPVSFKHKGLPERLVYAVEPEQWSRVAVIRCDLAAPIGFTTEKLFGEVDVIINLAADTHPPHSVAHPVEVMHNNTDIALYLLEYARLLDLRAFVQISTDAVYGDALGEAHREWDPIRPQNVYAASKATQEALAIAYWRSYDIPVVLATTMNPIGETQDPEKFIPNTIGKVLNGGIVTIHASLDGTLGRRTYVDVGDVADALLFILDKQPPTRYRDIEWLDLAVDGTTVAVVPGEDLGPDRWNITGPRELDNEEVVDLIAGYLGMEVKKEIIPIDQAALGHRYALDGGKLAEAGWRPSPLIDRSLQRIAVWTEEHRMWLR